jgi:hypothetical protein
VWEFLRICIKNKKYFLVVILNPIISVSAQGISAAKWRLFLSFSPVPTSHPGVAEERGTLWLGANFLVSERRIRVYLSYTRAAGEFCCLGRKVTSLISPQNFVRVRRCGCSSPVEPKKEWWHIPPKKKNTHSVKILVFLELVSAIFLQIGPVHCRSSGRRLRRVPIWNSQGIWFSKF